tara:strand:- start:6880 stop:7755 length:876 start_codon:yes stop_codon:yes gene_type:complete
MNNYKTKVLLKKKNIQLFLNKKSNFDKRKIIQMSYDIRSGHAIKIFSKRKVFFKKYIDEVVSLISKNFFGVKTILDCGSGELLTTNLLSEKMKGLDKLYCFDFSFKRLLDGKNFSNKVSFKSKSKLEIFCADMFNIPLPDNSIDLITTFQSLEPNGSYELKLIKELLRVSKKGLFLMEPDYENANLKQKKRMRKFNYVKNLPKVFENLKVKFKVIQMKNNGNNLNRCSAFIVYKKKTKKNNKPYFIDPANKKKLNKMKDFLYEKDDGNLYFSFKSIPILIKEKALFAPFLK